MSQDYTLSEFSRAIRDEIDTALAADIPPDTIKERLEWHADGVEYYALDAIRYRADLLDELDMDVETALQETTEGET